MWFRLKGWGKFIKGKGYCGVGVICRRYNKYINGKVVFCFFLNNKS